MAVIHTGLTVSVTELKRNPSALIEDAEGSPIAILNHNAPTAYLVPAATFTSMVEALEDLELTKIAKERLEDGSTPVKVDFNEL